MHAVLQAVQARGFDRLRASYLPTHKNGLVSNLLPRLGFAVVGGAEGEYERDLSKAPAQLPGSFPIQIEWTSPVGDAAVTPNPS